jgi:hypothetical protein
MEAQCIFPRISIMDATKNIVSFGKIMPNPKLPQATNRNDMPVKFMRRGRGGGCEEVEEGRGRGR